MRGAISKVLTGSVWKSFAMALLAGLIPIFITSKAPFSRTTAAAEMIPNGINGAVGLTPGPGAMTIYSVTNPDTTTTITVEHVFTNPGGFNYSFFSQVPPRSSSTYHVSTMRQIPSPFNGVLTLYSSQAFTAQIVGYDYPGSATPTGSPTGTPSITVTPTLTGPRSATPTGTPSITVTPIPPGPLLPRLFLPIAPHTSATN